MERNIHLITLKETPLRTEKALSELAKIPGLNIHVHTYLRQKEGWKGCIHSHIETLRFAQKQNLDWIWICEDNIYTRITDLRKLDSLFHFVETNTQWGMVFVGGYILRPWDYCVKTNYPGIYETRNNNHGSISYIMHKRMYTKLIERYDTIGIKENYDIHLARYTNFIHTPMMFYHAHDIRSNINSHQDLWRHVWFHPRVAAFNESIFFNKRMFNLVLFGILCFIVIVGLWISNF